MKVHNAELASQEGCLFHLAELPPVDPVRVAEALGMGKTSAGRSGHGVHADLHQGIEAW